MAGLDTHADAPVIEVRNLHKRYGEQRVHDGIDLQVRRGEFLSVIGTSGRASPRCCIR